MKQKHKPTFKPSIQKKLAAYISRQRKPFEFHNLKMAAFGYGDYGGKKLKLKVKQVFGLREFKKNGRVMLQKVRKSN
jgi:hypothetical protein